MAQADYEDTPENAATRGWRMGEAAKRIVGQARDQLAAAQDRRAPAGELRALVINQQRLLDRLLLEAKWADYVTVYGEGAADVLAA